ncbi:MAG TPA: hypothetical protein VM600_07060 [Actinomycetota bacterium]|nr:hypothetical protein [Actinomycetota bacterium]
MASTQTARTAVDAWTVAQRRRRTVHTFDRLADAAFASGGLVLANATLSLELNLPVGSCGGALSVALIAGALSWMSRSKRARTTAQPRPARRAPARAHRIAGQRAA